MLTEFSAFQTETTMDERGFPTPGQAHEEPVASIGRHAELESSPIAPLVSIYHSGRSDETKVHHELPIVHKHEDYPRSAVYEGMLSELHRRPEHSSEPVEPLVSVYHHGRSDQRAAPATMAHTPHPEGFPAIQTQPYDGPLGELVRSDELGAETLASRVLVYHPGRSDQQQQPPTHAEEEKAAPTALSRITSIFRRSAAHDDFPRSEPYIGALGELGTAGELHAEPMHTRVSAYHHGHSGEAPPTATEETRSEAEKKPDTLTRITSLFGKSVEHRADFPPVGAAYDGPLHTLQPQTDAERLALDAHVFAYHPGRSDEEKPKRSTAAEHVEPTAEGKEPAPAAALKKLATMFSRHDEFPHSEPFEGPLSDLARKSEICAEPLVAHVSAYHPTGRSDEHVELPHEGPHEPAKKHDTLSRIASLFSPKKVSSSWVQFIDSV
jgi:hypothetical protein